LQLMPPRVLPPTCCADFNDSATERLTRWVLAPPAAGTVTVESPPATVASVLEPTPRSPVEACRVVATFLLPRSWIDGTSVTPISATIRKPYSTAYRRRCNAVFSERRING